MTTNQAAMLAKAAWTHGDRPAVSLGQEVKLDYRQLAAKVAKLAGGLQSLDLAPGARIGLVMKNIPEYVEVLYAVWHAGFAAVPINAKLHPREYAYILENSGASLCFASPELMEDVTPLQTELPTLQQIIDVGGAAYQTLCGSDAAPVADTGPDDLAWLFYTSGTTGQPKGAMLSNRNLTSMVMNYYGDVDGISEIDCMIHCAPFSHGSGLYGLPHVAKAANNIFPTTGGFEPAECLDLIAHWPNCSFFFAPTMITRLINAPQLREADTGHLRTIIYGGGPMYVADTLKALDAFGPKLVQIYGQGESPMTITGLSKAAHMDNNHPRVQDRLGSAGIARTDVDVRVVDHNDNEVPTGEMGEIVCRGDVVMAGYYNNPDATADTLRGGWLHTGDVGAFDSDGFLTLKDRAKDMIISGGTNIYPREVEEVLLRHAGVLECSVIGKPHADWGEEVIAFVVKQEGGDVDETALDQLCLNNIARFKRPKHYHFVDALPKNNYGKVLKTELRQRL
jgi:acyl-CoA synthetase (AMP-forming)/AMP-acid ligase II